MDINWPPMDSGTDRDIFPSQRIWNTLNIKIFEPYLVHLFAVVLRYAHSERDVCFKSENTILFFDQIYYLLPNKNQIQKKDFPFFIRQRTHSSAIPYLQSSNRRDFQYFILLMNTHNVFILESKVIALCLYLKIDKNMFHPSICQSNFLLVQSLIPVFT